MSVAAKTISINTTDAFFDDVELEELDLGLVSAEALHTFQLICYGVLCQLMNLFGIVTNIINIICFAKQGFRESINLSLLGLAISDLGGLVTMVYIIICLTPAFQEADLPFDAKDSYYLTAGMPHLVFTRATTSITALIMLERCLCITMPLKVKNVFTSRSVAITIGVIYFILIVFISPIYIVTRYGMKFVSERNKTVIGVVFTGNRMLADQIAFTGNNVCVPLIALSIIIVCMNFIVVKLQRQAKWRSSSSVTSKADAASERDLKVAKMVVMISTLFVVCFIPSAMLFIATMIVPEISYEGKYERLGFLLYGICAFLESTNSSVNIFIYYYMSSKYRSFFQQLFRCSKSQ